MNESMEMMCFQLISNCGNARSNYVEAINQAKEGNYEEVEKLLEEANVCFNQGHKVHASMIAHEAQGNEMDFKLIIVHAEDILMSAETLKIISENLIDVYKKMNKGEK